MFRYILGLTLVGIIAGILLSAGCVEEDSGGGESDSSIDAEADGDSATDSINDTGADTGAFVELTWIELPEGTFQMGSNEVSSNEKPVHGVTVPGFEMMKAEVTVAQYGECVSAGACTEPKTNKTECNWGEVGYENHPVNCVTWHQAVSFCEWLGGRLPSEAEWEYAARSGGQDITYPWGDEVVTCDYAVMYEGDYYGCGTGRTSSVCSKTAGDTDQGLCDMAGNVWEWVEDDWHYDYEWAPVDGSAWVDDPRGLKRVLRGGGFVSDVAVALHAAKRTHGRPSYRFDDVGFRCAR